MKDHLLSWHEKFQPLGPALKTPRIEVDERSAIAEFEERSFDHPSCTGGNAPSLSPQALVPTRIGVIEVTSTPAARVFKVGDRVRVVNRSDVYAGDEGVLTDETCRHGFYTGDFTRHGRCYFRATQLEHIQPSDTQQWVEWKGGARPVEKDVKVEARFRDGSTEVRDAFDFDWWWCSEEPWELDILAFRVVQ